MNSKICTSIEQSKKFMELGIDVNSADMHYYKNSFGDYIEGLYHSSDLKEGFELKGIEYIPAWSLSALLELIPERMPGTKLVIKWDGSYYIEGRDCLFDTAIDAAFEMVCWLKKNNRL